MIVFSTSTFRRSLRKLCKKRQDNYSTCPSDICAELTDKTLAEIAGSGSALSYSGPVIFLKIRVACPSQRLSQSNGFRLICAIDTNTRLVTLLEVFPKRGKYGMNTLGDGYLDELIKEYVEQVQCETLHRHDIDTGLDDALKPAPEATDD